MVSRLIKSGVMNRLFGHFDFFSTLDRDRLSPRSSYIRKKREKPPKCGKRVDAFGEVVWDLAYGLDADADSSSSASDSSEGDCHDSASSDYFSFSDLGFVG